MLSKKSQVPIGNSTDTDIDGIKAESQSNLLEIKSRNSGWLKRFVRCLSISKKIGGGYFLSLGIATTGIIAGFTIGDYHQQQARESRKDTQAEIRFLNRLEKQVLQARTRQQQFISLIDKPKLLKQEYAMFLQNDAAINQIWSEVKFFVNSKHVRQGANANAIQHFIQTYKGVPPAYFQQVEELLRQINQLHSQQKISTAQKLLLNFNNNPTALKIDGISNELTALIESAYEENKNAEAALTTAEYLRAHIIALSILLSVIAATLLAIFTTHTITRPIIALTDVAHYVVQEANFDLQVPVTSEDEVGVLASSLNKLIQWVSHYIQKLEQAHEQLNQTLHNLQQSQAQLIQTEKMSSLGQMVAGVAHEINNPVNFIYGNLTHVTDYTQDLLALINLYQQRYPNTDPEIQELIEDIDLDFLIEDFPKILSSMKVGTDRIREIVLTLRNFSRLDEAEMKPVDIHEGIDSTLLILQHRLKANPEHSAIAIIKEYGDLPAVECYAGQLNQVFMNILSNAIDALNQHELELCPEAIKDHFSSITICTQIVNCNWVRISIKDNGPGMTDIVKARLFDPFFTTKTVGKGTGLGLSISYQIIVDKHGGQLKCLSEPGQGADFWIEIPLRQS